LTPGSIQECAISSPSPFAFAPFKEKKNFKEEDIIKKAIKTTAMKKGELIAAPRNGDSIAKDSNKKKKEEIEQVSAGFNPQNR